MRKVKIKDAKLKKILEKRGEILTKAREIQKEKEKLEMKQSKIGHEMNRLKEKTEPLVKEHEKGMDFGEFEYTAQFSVVKGEVVFSIKDQLEDYKEMLLEKKEEDKK
jgi:hypothetical protein|tara:strand:+ start:2849 stop:3169 length:321 start_codon:yes stop_codon:yes gene_type:complete